MYVSEGASLRPKQNPSNVNIQQINGNDWLNPKIIQKVDNGMLTSRRVFRRPILSLIGPLNKLPMGCAIWANMLSHDAWAAVMWTVSSGFISMLIPDKAGIKIVANPKNWPILKIIKFFAPHPNNWESRKWTFNESEELLVLQQNLPFYHLR